jgi:YihY family inner membrane protein
MNVIERGMRGVDRFHQRRRWIAFPYAVIKKFGDDQGGNLAALVAYYGFFSLFPLLMVFTTILGMVAASSPSLQRALLDSSLRSFPVLGTQISGNIHALNGGGVVLAIGIVLTLYSGIGVIRVFETGMNTVWNVPYKNRPNFVLSVGRALLMLAILGVITLLAAALGSVSAGSSTWWWWVLGTIGALVLNLVLFMLAFKVMTSADVSWSDVRPGAIVSAVAWTILQVLGGYYVGHQLKGASETYGTFAVVIGLLAWIYLGAQITLLAAEINVVKKRRLWPRGLVQPPLTEADKQAYTYYAKQEERRPEEEVGVEINDRRVG